jgi:hypothetical protein
VPIAGFLDEGKLTSAELNRWASEFSAAVFHEASACESLADLSLYPRAKRDDITMLTVHFNHLSPAKRTASAGRFHSQ